MPKQIKKIWKQVSAKKHIVGALTIFVLVLTMSLSSMLVLISPDAKAYPGEITPAIVSSYEWEATKGSIRGIGAVCRVNNSEYYLIAYSNTDYFGFLITLRAYNDDGTIVQSVISSYEFDAGQGVEANICHIPGTDKYVVAYRNITKTIVKTFRVWDTNGTIAQPFIDSQVLTSLGYGQHLLPITQNVWADVYTLSTGASCWIETLWIDNDGTINNTLLDSLNTTDITWSDGGIYALKIDSDTIAITYDSSTTFTIVTYNISSSGLITATPADSWDYDVSVYRYSCIDKVGSSVYCITYVDANGDLQTKTVAIADTGMITKSWIDTLTVVNGDAGAINQPETFVVQDSMISDDGSGVLGVTCQGVVTAEQDGYMYTWNVSDDGTIGAAIASSYEFDATLTDYYAPVTFVNNSWYLIVYSGPGDDGWSKTVSIETPAVPSTTPSSYSIAGLTDNKIDWAGLAGTAVWSNSTGDTSETLEINMVVNSSDNISEIRIWVGDLNDTVSWVNASNISLYISSDDSLFGLLGTYDDGGSNLSINSTTWSDGTMGTSPFTLGCITGTTKSIYCRFKLTIPATAGTYSYYNTETWYVYIGHYA